ncbi:MAG: STAS/SEC14 domain-containing protein [Rhizobiaceae bacterium]|nr:STAS/SEC14 domain-containing protein [Rhizobiaceae bacterium]
MTAMNNPPSIRRIDTGRPDLFAVEVAGHVSAADVENLYGLLEGVYVTQERIDLLIRVVGNEGVDWKEVSPNTVREAQQHAREHISRCAAIGENSATRRIAEIFCPSGAELRHFALDAEEEAWEWLA